MPSNDHESTKTTDTVMTTMNHNSAREASPLIDTEPLPPTTSPREMTPDLPPTPSTRKRSTNQGRGYASRPASGPLELFTVGVSGRVRRNPAHSA
jgi:hypothetical protein